MAQLSSPLDGKEGDALRAMDQLYIYIYFLSRDSGSKFWHCPLKTLRTINSEFWPVIHTHVFWSCLNFLILVVGMVFDPRVVPCWRGIRIPVFRPWTLAHLDFDSFFLVQVPRIYECCLNEVLCKCISLPVLSLLVAMPSGPTTLCFQMCLQRPWASTSWQPISH